MSRTATPLADMSVVTPSEESSLSCDRGLVSYCGGEDAVVCVASDEFCPMLEVVREKDRQVAEQEARLAVADHHMRHLDGLAKLGELSAVVAHEIRNPLAGISATAEVLLDDIPAEDPRHESVDVILCEIQRLEKTVRNLLDFARDRKPFITRVDLRDVVERVLGAIEHQAKERGVSVTGICPNDLPDAEADPELLEQAFTNISLNAIQAMSCGGQLTVKLYGERDARGPRVGAAITDSGCGIKEQDIGKIFDPFFTTKTSGAGLGLAVSKKIIEAQNGFIVVESTPGRGTTFVVSLPAAREIN